MNYECGLLMAPTLKSIYTAFGDRIEFAAFSDAPEKIDKDRLKSSKLRYEVRATTEKHPLPAGRPDKALVVVACVSDDMKTVQIDKWYFWKWAGRLIVDDEVLAVNGPGTFTYLFLDPGEHQLVTLAMDGAGLRMTLEAGKDYYFLQQLYIAGSIKSVLNRHSKELVLYEAANSAWPEWRLVK